MTSKVEPYFDEIIALVADGVPVAAALRRRPEYPPLSTWKFYAYDNRFPDRRQRLSEALAAGKAIRALSYKLQHYTEEQYERSLAIVRDNFPTSMIKLRFDGCPGYNGLWVRAKADPEFAARFAAAKAGRRWGGKVPTYSDDAFDRAVGLIRAIGLTSYRNLCGSEGLPSQSQLWRRSLKDKAFGRRYAMALMNNRVFAPEQLRSELLSNALYARINRCVPRVIDPSTREDVISDLIEAVLSGRISEDEIEARCGDYVGRHDRMFSKFRCASLDAPILDDSGANLLNRLSADSVTLWGI